MMWTLSILIMLMFQNTPKLYLQLFNCSNLACCGQCRFKWKQSTFPSFALSSGIIVVNNTTNTSLVDLSFV